MKLKIVMGGERFKVREQNGRDGKVDGNKYGNEGTHKKLLYGKMLKKGFLTKYTN